MGREAGSSMDEMSNSLVDIITSFLRVTMLMGIRGLLDCMLACSCVVVEQSRNEGTAAR